MVEDVLKSEAPREDFSQRILELFSQVSVRPVAAYRDDIVPEIRQIGAQGIDGYLQAMDSPYWQARVVAVGLVVNGYAPETRDKVFDLVRRAMTDPNKKVRRGALYAVSRLPVSEADRREHLIPLAVLALFDRAKCNRRMASWELQHNWAGEVPLATAVRAMLDERDPATRRWKEYLVRAVLDAQSADGAATPDRASTEHLEAMLASLSDPSSAVRAKAAANLLDLPISHEQKRRQVLPKLVGLLQDRAKRVRRRVAFQLYPWAPDVPADAVEKACRVETDPIARRQLDRLLRKIARHKDQRE